MIAASQRAVPTGDFSVADMRSYILREKVQAVVNMLSLFLLSRQELEAMSQKWSEWLLPGGLLCICTMLAEDVNATKEMYEADGLYASGMDFQFMGEKVKMRLVGFFFFLLVVNRLRNTYKKHELPQRQTSFVHRSGSLRRMLILTSFLADPRGMEIDARESWLRSGE